MPVFFVGKPGNVVQINDPTAQCTVQSNVLSLDPKIDWNAYRAIITRVTVEQHVNAQFLHTLSSSVYVYVFGDRIGTVTLSGLSFMLCPCPSTESAGDVYNWYKVNRASRRKEPVTVTVGEAVIKGFVVSFTEDVVDPSISLIQWGVNMTCLPGEA